MGDLKFSNTFTQDGQTYTFSTDSIVMHHFHGLKTMTFHDVADIAYF